MAEPTSKPFEIFHVIADASSAAARRFVSDHELGAFVRLRNITYPEVKADFDARAGQALPALWDGKTFTYGTDAIIAKLKAFMDVGRE